MIDGIKSFSVVADPNELQNNPNLQGCKKTVTENNETVYIYPYCGLTFKVRNNSVSLYGSLHKYFNTGQNNNDFTRSQLTEVLNDLWKRFGVNVQCTPLNGVEIGVNLNYPPQRFINSIIDYKGGRVNITNKDFLYSECELSRYVMKSYEKGGMLRVEVRFNRMYDLKKNGITTLADLAKLENYKVLASMIIEYFDNYLTFDGTINMDRLNQRQRELILNGQNTRYWEQLRLSNPEKYKKQRGSFKNLIQINNQNSIQANVRNLIIEKTSLLLCENEKTFPELTECRKFKSLKSFPKLTESKACKNYDFDNSQNMDFPRINTLDEVTFRGKFIDKKKGRFCLVTGLDISMQKEESFFICSAGIKWYCEHDKNTFDLKLYPRVSRSKKFKNAPKEIQIEEIHHSIRNEFNNCLHNYHRDSVKRGAKLFDDSPYLADNLKAAILKRTKITNANEDKAKCF